jgi:hypothetical protein
VESEGLHTRVYLTDAQAPTHVLTCQTCGQPLDAFSDGAAYYLSCPEHGTHFRATWRPVTPASGVSAHG